MRQHRLGQKATASVLAQGGAPCHGVLNEKGVGMTEAVVQVLADGGGGSSSGAGLLTILLVLLIAWALIR
jgi:hypothetical protein